MLDIKELRLNSQAVYANLLNRGFKFDIAKFNALEETRKALQIKTQNLQNMRNAQSKVIGVAKAKGENIEPLLQEVATLGLELKNYNDKLEAIQQQLSEYLLTVPNLLHASVPIGKSEADNKLIRASAKPKEFAFTPKEHFELGESLNKTMDFELSANISGARFVVLKNKLARLHRALAQFMLDLHINEHGYEEVNVPYLVKAEAMYGTGQFPKFREDQFGIHDSDLWLIPTSEVPVTNLVRECILDVDALPLKFACLSTCFRKEAGSYGKDTKGMLRQHQFDKVELVHITHPEKSYAALEELVTHAEAVLQQLQLPYRIMSLCSMDVGFAAAKTYDLEVWLPGQRCFREISSCSNTESFQARRMLARVKMQNNKNEFVHTLNGSGVAVGRALIAVMENYQDAKGRILIPEVLLPYMGGIEVIE